MTVSAQTPINRSTGNGVTTVFPYTFKIVKEADIEVSVDDVVKTLNVDFTVTGAGDDAGGNVVMTAAPAASTKVIRRRSMSIVRTTDYQDQGTLPADTLDADLDAVVLMVQQVNESFSRSLKLPISSTGSADLPAPSGGAVLGWNADGTALINVPLQAGTSLVDLAASSGASLVGYLPVGTGAVATTVQSKLRERVSVLDFGADPTGIADSTSAIQNAINSLAARGGTVSIPSGTYKISSQITIGNGNGGSTASTKNAVKLQGAGAGFAVSGALVPTIFNWAGTSTVNPVLLINGQISDVLIDGIFIACNGLSGGISAKSISGSTFSNLKIVNPATNANALTLLGGTTPTGNYNTFNKFSKIQIGLLSPTSNGLYIDGDYASTNDTWISQFELVRVETFAGATSARCAWLKFVDSCTFTRCHLDAKPEATSLGLVLDATGNPGSLNDYPMGLSFYDCSISKIDVIETAGSKIGPCYFYGYGANDFEEIPTHPRLMGITANGNVFGPMSGFKDKKATDIVVANTAVVSSVYSYIVGAYFLGGMDSFRAKNGGLRVKSFGKYTNASGALADFTVTVTFGGATLFSATFAAVPSAGSARSFQIEFVVFLSNNSAVFQAGEASCVMGAAGSAEGTLAAQYQAMSGTSSIGVDTSSAKTLDISVKHSVASTGLAYTANSTTLELL